ALRKAGNRKTASTLLHQRAAASFREQSRDRAQTLDDRRASTPRHRSSNSEDDAPRRVLARACNRGFRFPPSAARTRLRPMQAPSGPTNRAIPYFRSPRTRGRRAYRLLSRDASRERSEGVRVRSSRYRSPKGSTERRANRREPAPKPPSTPDP